MRRSHAGVVASGPHFQLLEPASWLVANDGGSTPSHITAQISRSPQIRQIRLDKIWSEASK